MSEFKVGDMARVVDSVSEDCRAWPYWQSAMNQYVNDGIYYIVERIDADGDVVLTQDGSSWVYPSYCLEKAGDKKQSTIGNISVTGYLWNGCTYSTKTTLTRSIVKDAYNRFTKSNGDPVFIQQLIDELKEIKEECQKLI